MSFDEKIAYTTIEGKFEVDNKNLLLLNGKPLTIDSHTFKYSGIAQIDRAKAIINKFIEEKGTKHMDKNPMQITYLAYETNRFLEATFFSRIKDSRFKNTSIAGYNKEHREIYLSSKVEGLERV